MSQTHCVIRANTWLKKIVSFWLFHENEAFLKKKIIMDKF